MKLRHRWGHFDAPGDYILTNDKVKQLSMNIPKIFDNKKKKINCYILIINLYYLLLLFKIDKFIFFFKINNIKNKIK